MGATQHPVFTIGHSNHAAETFLAMLRRHHVDDVVDVRSSAFSRYSPQFNRDALDAFLETNGIAYTFMGGELGGRPSDHALRDQDGRADYELLAGTDAFGDGIAGVVRRADDAQVVVMCSEKEPLDCHRALLVARALVDRGVEVAHILADGRLEPHEDTLDRLIDLLKMPPNGDMFRSRDDVVIEAIGRRARAVAYVAESGGAYDPSGGEPAPSERDDAI